MKPCEACQRARAEEQKTIERVRREVRGADLFLTTKVREDGTVLYRIRREDGVEWKHGLGLFTADAPDVILGWLQGRASAGTKQ